MPKKIKKKLGRPQNSGTKLSDITVGKIIDILRIDGTIEEACAYAGINPDTHYEWIKSKKIFPERNKIIDGDGNVAYVTVNKLYEDAIKEAKQYPAILARKTFFKSITSGNSKDALEFLRRRDNRYKDKSEQDHKGNPFEGISINVKKKK